MTANVF